MYKLHCSYNIKPFSDTSCIENAYFKYSEVCTMCLKIVIHVLT